MAIEFTVLANKSNANASTKVGKTVSTTKGAAPAVTLEYLLEGVKNGSKEPAFARQLGEAIMNGIAGKEGRPARMNGQDVSEADVAAYLALPQAVRGAIKFEPAVPAVAGVSALIVSGHIHNLLIEIDESGAIYEAKESTESEELDETAEGGELDEFLK